MPGVAASFRRRFTFGLCGLALVCACSSETTTDVETSSSPATVVSPQPGGMRSGSEWPSYNGGYDATRFSALSQVSTNNVASLAEVARFSLPETTAFQSGPVLIDGTLYVTTAIDARMAEQRWVQRFEPKSLGIETPCAAWDTRTAACSAEHRMATCSRSTPEPARSSGT